MNQKTSRLRALVERYVDLSARHSALLLIFYVCLSVIAIYFSLFHSSTKIRIDTNFEPLLPQGTSSVAALHQSRERSGSSDLYTVAINSPDPEANVRFMKDISARLEQWEETQWVQIDRDTSFFSDRALLYLPEGDLAELRDRLQKEVKLEKKRNNPFYVDLRTPEEKKKEDAERWQLSQWLADDLPERLGLERELFNQILATDKLGLDDSAEKEGKTEEKKNAQNTKPEDPKLPAHLKHFLISEDGKVAAVLASLSQPPTDALKSQELMERGTALIDELDPKTYHPEMKSQVVGAYRTFQEVKSISNDSNTATITSIVFVLVVLFGFFRNARSVLLLILPLLLGVSWSVGMTALTYGHLNISTLFVFSMLVGMGIDFGIHYYARILEEYGAGKPMAEAVVDATLTTGRSMVSAAITTIIALLTLLAAHFQGFVEFGIIASYGIALCLVSSLLVTPSCIFILEKISKTKRRSSHNGEISNTPVAKRRLIRTVAFALMIVGVLGSVGAAVNWDKASFEHDFRRLRGKRTKNTVSYGKALGRNRSTTPSMILGESPEQMREVHETLTKLTAQNQIAQEKYDKAKKALPPLDENNPKSVAEHAKIKAEFTRDRTFVKNFVTVQTFVPPNQEKRLKIIQEINDLVSDRKLNRSKGKAKTFLQRIRDLSSVKTFTIEEVPGWASRSIVEKNGTIGAIGYLYSDVHKWDMIEVQDFHDRVGKIKVANAEVPIASSQFILSDVIKTVKEDSTRLLPIVFALLLVILLLDLRSPIGALVCLLTMGVALLWTVGGMILFDIRLGLYNMVLLPMVLGTGIDGSIHLYHRYKELGPEKIWHVFSTTGASVMASSMTTLAGFAGLLFVDHMGIKSIGTLAVVGIAATLLAIFSFMPGLLTLAFDRTPLNEEETK